MTLKAIEFIRRFLLHVLPTGFVRIRHYGFLANRVCRENLELCRDLLEDTETCLDPAVPDPPPEQQVAVEGDLAMHVCPACGKGRMIIVEILGAVPVDRSRGIHREPTAERAAFDTS